MPILGIVEGTNVLEIPVVILAGGDGRRIGGGKAKRRLGGKTLLDHAIAKAVRCSSIVGVSVRSGEYSLPQDIHLLHDQDDIAGPIAGLAAALEFARDTGSTHVAIMPCDTPFLPDDLFVRLRDGIGGSGVAMPQYAGQMHPACSLWLTETAQRLPEYLSEGRRSLMGLAEAVGYALIEWPIGVRDPFFNINTICDLADAEQILALLGVAP